MIEVRIRAAAGGYLVERIDLGGASTFYVAANGAQLATLVGNILPAPAPLPTAPIP